MKYLYKILRLFFCPHKYKWIDTVEVFNENGQKIAGKLICQCYYCGKIHSYRI